LGIGTNSPGSELTIDKNFNGRTEIRINNYSTGTSAAIGLTLYQDPTTLNRGGIYKYSINTNSYKIFAANDFGYYNSIAGDISILNDVASGRIKFAAGASSTAQATLFSTGNFIVGGTTDGGQRLQVQGDAFIKGSGATFATNALTIQNSSSANLFRVQNDGAVFVGTFQAFSTSSNIGFFLTGSSAVAIGGTNATNFQNTDTFQITRPYTPSGGTFQHTLINITSTINQTGGANGITRGLYVNPTLTAAADWRSIEWSNNSGWGLYGAGTANNYLGGRLGIGNTSPAQPLDLLFNNSSSAATGIVVKNSNSAGRASAAFYNNNNEGGVFSTYGSTFPTSAYINNFVVGATKAIIFLADSEIATGGSSRISWVTGGYNVAAAMTLTAAGRLLLGTTTESTFLLDVNGTARVSGAMRFDNAVEFRSTNGNTKFTVQANTGWNTTISTGSFGSAGIRFGDGAFANVLIGQTSDSFNGSAMLDLRSNSLGLYLNRGTISTMPNLTSWAGITLSIVGGSGYTNGAYNGVSATGNYFGTVAVNVTISGGAVTSISLFGGGSKIQLGETFTIPASSIGGTGSGMSFTITAINNQNPAFTFYNTTNNFLTYWDGVNYATPIVSKLDRVLVGGTGLANATSILELSSSTQGFLPPRGTNTQMLAIASPVAGLMFYDTTNNKLNCYDGTTWQACW
jgi:hypothetical protein